MEEDLPIREIDTSSIQQQMSRNKEQLQIKLMVRRPISQLIEQGIIPPLRQSPVLYEQTKKLERARTEDYLKHKISNRPNRQELIQHHILEDTNISPMLIAKQQQLKKAKLADNLNERLSHRPGPLELIKGNILLPSNLQIGQAVKQGTIEFKPTSCGEIKYPQPSFLILKKDQQQSTNDPLSPSSHNHQNKQNGMKTQSMKSCNNYHFDHHCNSLVKSNTGLNTDLVDTNTGLIEALGGRAATSETTNGVVSVNKVAELDDGGDDENDDSNHTCSSSYSSDSLNENEESSILNSMETDSPSQMSRMPKSNENSLLATAQSSPSSQPSNTQTVANQFTQQSIQKSNKLPNNNSNNSSNIISANLHSPMSKQFLIVNRPKKNKIKIQSKNKIIKFHEYKGPPNAIKQSTFNSDCSRTETAYELLLQQQQLYLQLELEMQQKQQQLTNQRIESLNQKDHQEKTNSSNSLLMSNNMKNSSECNNSSAKMIQSSNSVAANKTTVLNHSEPSSPMQLSKANSQTSLNVDQQQRDQEKEDPQTSNNSSTTMSNNNITILNTSMVNTSMSITPAQQINKTVSFDKTDSPSLIDSMTDINKIEEMKVNDLKQELKRFNLPVSGSKTTLIERLKNYVAKSRYLLNKTSNSPQMTEPMEIDSPKTQVSSPSSLTSSPSNSNNSSTTPAASSSQNLYTNTISSTPVTTFATLAPADLLGTTAFLAQNPTATILRSAFNPTPQNTTTTTSFITTGKPPTAQPASQLTGQIIKTQTSLTTNLKQQQEQNNKARRISEPQLQHIQLHFTNPFLQFATTAQSPLNNTPLANRNTGAQQIHFLSTPALNTNDLHLFTQPTLLTSNNRILQPTNTSFTSANQPTTWTLQPSNNFPQLFFYPTQLTTAATAQTNSSNGLATVNTNSPSANNLLAAASTTSLNLNNQANNVNLVNSQIKTEQYSSDSDPIVATTDQQQQQQQQKPRQKSTKNSTKQQTKGSKKSELNKKMSISLSSNNVNSGLNNNMDGHHKKSGLNDVNSSTTSLPNNLSNGLNCMSNDSGSMSNSMTNVSSNNNLNANSYSSYVPETKIENNGYSTIIGQQQQAQTFENAQQILMTNSSYLQNASSLQNFFTTNSSLLIDKQPPSYEMATNKNNQLGNLRNNNNGQQQSNGQAGVPNNSNLNQANYSSSVLSNKSASSLVNEQLNNNVTNGMNANYSSSNSTNSSSYSSSSILKQTNNNSMHQDSNNRQTATPANLIRINSLNIGNSSIHATGKGGSQQQQQFLKQSSSLDLRNLNSKNVEFQNPTTTSFIKQESTDAEDNLHHKSCSEFYSSSTTSVNSSSYESFGSTTNSFESNQSLEYSSASSSNGSFVSFHHFPTSSQGINPNSNNCYQKANAVNCINNQVSNQAINHQISHLAHQNGYIDQPAIYQPSHNQMETENMSNNTLNQSSITNQHNTPNQTNSHFTTKSEVDFNIDFDLLMDDFFDFECTYNRTCSEKQQSDQACKLENGTTDSDFMEVDANNGLTIDTNFDDEFNAAITEQSLHTPTLPEQADFEALPVQSDQIINSLVDTNNTNNSMIFDNNHHFNSISYNDHYNDLLFQNS